MEDDKIVQLFLERSEQALAETRNKYYRYCYSIAYKILQYSEDADELISHIQQITTDPDFILLSVSVYKKIIHVI